jgi:hypothetical protein
MRGRCARCGGAVTLTKRTTRLFMGDCEGCKRTYAALKAGYTPVSMIRKAA